MTGAPTETEIRAQWVNAVDILETIRNFADGTMMGAGGKFDVMLQSLEGQYTPTSIANAVALHRATLSSAVSPTSAANYLLAVIREYGKIIADDATAFGSGYADDGELFSALYEYFHDNNITIKTRGITYDTTATLGAGNVGNGAMLRLTEDQNGYPLENCTVERKTWRCRQDVNSGVLQEAEVFEFVGTQASQDDLERYAFGSGEAARTFLVSGNAGGQRGGSFLRNSSFTDFNNDTTDEKFAGWAQTYSGSASGALVGQATGAGNFYRTHPGASADASLQLSGPGTDSITLTQTVANMRVRRLDPNTPYFLRLMVNKTPGTGDGGTLILRIGSSSVSIGVTALGAGWQELVLPANNASWYRTFNQDPLGVEIEWQGGVGASGFLLIDDVIFAPYTLSDGTYWFLRGNAPTHIPWLVDDTLQFTDTGGSPADGKLQWWLYILGIGYLPNSPAPTIADPP